MKKLPEGEKLIALCKELGLPIRDRNVTGSVTGLTESELQRQVMEFYRSQREGRLWIVAVIAAGASVASAIAAILAVVLRGGG